MYDKPKVTISLEEYQDLKAKKSFIDEAIEAAHRPNIRTAEDFNRYFDERAIILSSPMAVTEIGIKLVAYEEPRTTTYQGGNHLKQTYQQDSHIQKILKFFRSGDKW